MPRKHPQRIGTGRRSFTANLAAQPAAEQQRHLNCGCRTDGRWRCSDHWAELPEAERIRVRGRGGAA